MRKNKKMEIVKMVFFDKNSKSVKLHLTLENTNKTCVFENVKIE